MAKKKKRNWLEERDQNLADASKLLNVKGSYEERVKARDRYAQEREIAGNTTQAETSDGEIIPVTQAPDFVSDSHNINYQRHLTNVLGKNLNGMSYINQKEFSDYKNDWMSLDQH